MIANNAKINLLFGIILHKLPAAFALVLLLLASKFKNSFIILCLSIFAIMSPLGALLAEFLHFTPTQTAIALAIVIGSFFHIAFVGNSSFLHALQLVLRTGYIYLYQI